MLNATAAAALLPEFAGLPDPGSSLRGTIELAPMNSFQTFTLILRPESLRLAFGVARSSAGLVRGAAWRAAYDTVLSDGTSDPALSLANFAERFLNLLAPLESAAARAAAAAFPAQTRMKGQQGGALARLSAQRLTMRVCDSYLAYFNALSPHIVSISPLQWQARRRPSRPAPRRRRRPKTALTVPRIVQDGCSGTCGVLCSSDQDCGARADARSRRCSCLGASSAGFGLCSTAQFHVAC
eukprot:tig00021435_g21423.t1